MNELGVSESSILFAPKELKLHEQDMLIIPDTEITLPSVSVSDILDINDFFTKTLSSENKSNIAFGTVVAIAGQSIPWAVLDRVTDMGLISPEIMKTLAKLIPTLPHSSNMAVSAGSMALTVMAGEKLAKLSSNKETQDTIRNATSVLGILTIAAIQKYVETYKIMPGDYTSSGDFLWGTAVILPAFYAMRYLIVNKGKIRGGFTVTNKSIETT